MAKRARLSQDETLDLYANEGAAEDRLREIERLLDGLSVAELRIVRVLAGKKQKEKLEDAKTVVLAEIEGRVKALGLRLRDVFPSHKPTTKPSVPGEIPLTDRGHMERPWTYPNVASPLRGGGTQQGGVSRHRGMSTGASRLRGLRLAF